tara:strand:- start:540 stop:722 length:183 start_codon:yes stop_codon:yes gene_type:complete
MFLNIEIVISYDDFMTIKVIYIKGYDDLTTLHPKIFVVKTNSDIKNIISVGNRKVVIWLS